MSQARFLPSHLVRLPLLLPICLTLSCANWASIHREFEPAEGKGVLIDIKQRAIIVNKTFRPTNPYTVCAEPSPDALSAYTAQLAAKADVNEKVSAQLSTALQEGSTFTGLRTQSIQLLRDSLFRLCESYANGALEPDQYALLMRRYQRNTAAYLAIEQLSGVVRVPPMSISTSGAAELLRSLDSLQSEKAKVDVKVDELQKKKDAAADADKPAIDKELNAQKANQAALETAIKTARESSASGSATVTILPLATPPPPAEGPIKVVTAAISGILAEIAQEDDFAQACLTYLFPRGATLPADDPRKSLCLERLTNLNGVVKNKAVLMAAQAKWLAEHPNVEPAQFQRFPDFDWGVVAMTVPRVVAPVPKPAPAPSPEKKDK